MTARRVLGPVLVALAVWVLCMASAVWRHAYFDPCRASQVRVLDDGRIVCWHG
jgi:hypothetical protein